MEEEWEGGYLPIRPKLLTDEIMAFIKVLKINVLLLPIITVIHNIFDIIKIIFIFINYKIFMQWMIPY